MSRIFFLVTAFLFLSLSDISAQSNSGEISGIIKDIQQDPVSGAEISLILESDSSVVQRKISKDNGRFVFTGLKASRYILKVNAKGNQLYKGTIITLGGSQMIVRIPLIILTPEKQKNLKEVVVQAKKPLIEKDLDKTIVNVDAMISAATSNVLEILEKTPGVAVASDGEITLDNKSGVLVLIEGRQTYMSMADLAAYLRSIPGASIDKIELMTNPPARYDAAGGAVINIRFKKNKQAGFTGNLNTGFSQGINNRWNSALNFNYNTKKYSLFGNFSIYDERYFGDDRSYRTYSDSSQATLLNYNTGWNTDLNARVGIDYSLSQKTSVGMQISGSYRTRKEEMLYNNYFNESGITTDPDAYGTMNGKFRWSQYNINGNFLHKFNTSGRELSADANYIRYNNDVNQLFNNYLNEYNSSADSNYLFSYAIPSTIDIYTAKVDYNHPLKNKATLSGGLKTSFVVNDNISDYYDEIDGGKIPNLSKSNHFTYRENINAAYVNGRKDWKRISAQLGLRVENTHTEGYQHGNATVPENKVSRNYTGFFPSLFMSFTLDSAAKQKISVNLARRISRPYYQQLNPFLVFIDQYNYRTGNPYLSPAYNYYAEIGYNYKQWFSVNVQYDRYDDAIFTATGSVDSIFINRPENAAMRRMLATNFNLQLPVAKWWRSNFMFSVANFKTKGNLYGESLSQNINAFRIQSFNMFSFKKDWSMELVARYTHRVVNLQRIMEPRWYMNFAVQKKILKGKGFLKLTVDDIFWSLKYKETILTNGAEAVHYEIRDSRRVGLAFNFNFGKETFTRKRRNVDGADDMKGRVE